MTPYQVHGEVAIIRTVQPPLHALDAAARSAILAGVRAAESDEAIKAIVLIGTDAASPGKGEITEVKSQFGFEEPSLGTLISYIETSTKPVIAAIGGLCMGGGFELALGCHFRFASAGARVAMPEVKIGLCPSGGGSQRLPRLIGLEAALNVIISGEAVPAGMLRDTPLFDGITEGDLLQDTLAFTENVVSDKLALKRARDQKVRHAKPDAFLLLVRNSLGAATKNYPAPLACVDAVEASLGDFDAGIKKEKKIFLDLLSSDEAKALRHLHFAERKAPHIDGLSEGVVPRPVTSVGIVGAGTMGAGIAINFLLAGIPATIVETKQESLDRGVQHIQSFFEARVKKGKMQADEASRLAALLKPTLSFADLSNADLVIEAVFEDMEVKKTVFQKLDEICKPGAILASNTSTLDVNVIASFTKRPMDVLGAHFFSPANVMKLLEVVRGDKTADDVLLTIMLLAKKIKKIAVVSGVCDGFIGNRMIGGYSSEAAKLLEEGATVQQVDGALEKFGMAMGPFRMSDLAGNDIGWAIRKRIRAERPEMKMPTTAMLADKLCELGRFGQKTGSGWYRYEKGGRTPQVDPAVGKLVEDHRATHGIVPRKVSDGEIVQRCIFALSNEGARILEEGIAQRASDIDVVYIFGYGFPPYRGGPMHYADSVGLLNVERAIEGFMKNEQSEPRYGRVASLLSQFAIAGKTFN
ncbi:3-hydroxyacyl-CoA dehydrogenase NAD-binding domain-containing protein [Noviherbaspirillum sp. Root189]|uniref:3-hydroxyacyl-CoA dehydrogenase NAD-binding domain-containing protein n=1 Tax=Noviherbaspirillum sp. Root189 TaxID=1736487 RepID=UPI00070E5BD1|nr:3-hydroxyacyl-CoA dehydrogenase NAD-binding domain-containing protein [Noviherbaspirillum sp. Root189]KRB82184.1 3-hydroxyacyl-CoA dehydrogenase [Noviherbaspirillum sp. Root189]